MSVHAFLYSNGQVTDLGLGAGYGINNAGQVVGSANNGYAFLYSNGQVINLGALGGNGSVAYGINDAGRIVGEAAISNALPRAFLYSDGQMMNLNDLVDPTLGITLGEAVGINDNGQIVANDVSREHAYLLTPVPEPVSWALVFFSGLILLAQSRRYWKCPPSRSQACARLCQRET